MQKTAAIAAIAVIVLVGAGAWSLQNSKEKYSGTLEPITIGVPKLESSTPFYVADEAGYFAANGLNVTVRDYGTGLDSLNGMLKGDVDISAPAEFVLVGSILKHQKTLGIAVFDKVDYLVIIGRKDRGIENASDLRGKKIGLARCTIEEFCLGRYLDIHGLSLRDVTLVDMSLSQAIDAITGGDVDAVVSVPPYSKSIEDQLGDGVVVLSAQSNQAIFEIVACRDDWITVRPDLVKRVLRSLDEANEYIISHPAESKAIVEKRLNIDVKYMDKVWQQNQFSLSLDQSLILAMEDEARWMIKNNLTTEKQVPNFLDYIHEDGLKAIKPESVNIIR